MAGEVFNRYEKKYLIDGILYQKLRDELKIYMELDSHNISGKTYSVSNIYYDTPDSMRSASERYSFRIKFDKYVKGQRLLNISTLSNIVPKI